MNKIFKVIWNPATGNYTVTSETAKSRGKKSGRSKLLISALVAGGLLSSFGALADNYDGQGVDYGDGSASDGWVAIGKGAKANIFLNNAGVDSIGQRNSYVKTWGCGGFLNETNIYSR
ncbi:ESPR domain-containing protein, partial [Escherichia coli]|uniref:ESPR domain-containing protein n=5 Tax=Escherichia coli TaxID=562 RepID=UPI001F33C9D7